MVRGGDACADRRREQIQLSLSDVSAHCPEVGLIDIYIGCGRRRRRSRCTHLDVLVNLASRGIEDLRLGKHRSEHRRLRFVVRIEEKIRRDVERIMLCARAQHRLVVARRSRQTAQNQIELARHKPSGLARRAEDLVGPLRILRIIHRLALKGTVPCLIAQLDMNLAEYRRPRRNLAARDTQRTPGIGPCASQILDEIGHLRGSRRRRNRDPRIGTDRLAKLQELVNAIGNIGIGSSVCVEPCAIARERHLQLVGDIRAQRRSRSHHANRPWIQFFQGAYHVVAKRRGI